MATQSHKRVGKSAQSSGAAGKASKTVLKDQVYERIRMDIISFELKPGERISETLLATRFEVGLASIRAVLPRLVQEGLMSSERRRGHIVAPITMQEIHDTCQMREILESKAAELAAKKIDISILEAIDERSKAPVPHGNRDAEMVSLLANREFHVAIAAATGNERMRAWVAQLQDYSIRFQYLLRHSQSLSDDWEHSHEPIIAAFRNRNPAEASEVMRVHLSTARRHLLQSVLTLPSIQDVNIGDI